MRANPPSHVDTERVIEAKGLTFGYSRVAVLEDVSFSVNKGEFVSIIGPSGCGKSTLLLLVAGLLKANEGTITSCGRPVNGPAGDRAMVFQSFALLPWKSALHNVMVGQAYRRKGRSKSELRDSAMHYLELVGLKGNENKYPHQLSGGMQQRVGLARAFAAESETLLMDEPFAAIDAQNAEILREELRSMIAAEQRTILFITHNMDEALFLSNRVILMSADPGCISEEVRVDLPQIRGVDVGTPEERLRYGEYRSSIWTHLRREVRRDK
ncbi:MAG TPA: ABC transporter ATP-binding protein [Nocardioides sp.]